MKEVLAIAPVPTHPSLQGTGARVCRLLAALQAFGHRITFVHVAFERGDIDAMRCCWDEVYSVPVPVSPGRLSKQVLNRVLPIVSHRLVVPYGIDDWYPRHFDAWAARTLDLDGYDMVIVTYAFLSRALELFPARIVKCLDTIDVLGDRHRLFHGIGHRASWFFTTSQEERRGLQRADVIVAIQETEAAYFRTLVPDRAVITVGHQTGAVQPEGAESPHERLLFVGSANRLNAIALQGFLVEVFQPLRARFPGLTLDIVGAVGGMLGVVPAGCRVAGPAESLARYYGEAWIVVNPMVAGTGLKIKTVEALAYGKALVTTSAGAHGLERGAGTAFEVADDAVAAIATITRLLANRADRTRLGGRASRFYREYSDTAMAPLRQLLAEPRVVSGRGLPTGRRGRAGRNVRSQDDGGADRDRLTVLHVVPYFPPERLGGVGEVAAHLHRGLLARGYGSRVVTTGTSSGEPLVTRLPVGPAGWVVRSAALAREARHADVIHCHHGEAFALLLKNHCVAPRTAVVCTFHCSCAGIAAAHRPYTIEGRWFGWDREALRQRMLAPLRHVLDLLALRLIDEPNFISDHGAADFGTATAGRRSTVVPYGLPAAPRSSSTPSASPPTHVELLFVGSASHRKRVIVLPFVLRRVRERMSAVRLRLIGFSLGDQPRLRRLFAELGVLDAVVDEGVMRSEDIPPYYRASDILLVPSAFEGLPMVILEAMQCGLVPVATRVSAHPEAIEHGKTGMLVALDDPEQMAACCLELLQNDGLRRQLGEAARRMVAERFSADRQIDAYLDIYRRLRTDRGSARRDA